MYLFLSGGLERILGFSYRSIGYMKTVDFLWVYKFVKYIAKASGAEACSTMALNIINVVPWIS